MINICWMEVEGRFALMQNDTTGKRHMRCALRDTGDRLSKVFWEISWARFLMFALLFCNAVASDLRCCAIARETWERGEIHNITRALILTIACALYVLPLSCCCWMPFCAFVHLRLLAVNILLLCHTAVVHVIVFKVLCTCCPRGK